MNKKTERKNKTNQIINWPSASEYFTIDSLIENNKHLLTASGSDITLRVKLNDAIVNKKTIAVIGTHNRGKGRPKLAFAMTPVTQLALDKAKNNGIMLLDETRLVTIMEIKPITENISTVVSNVNISSVTAITQ